MIVISKRCLILSKIGVVTSPSGAVIRDIITTVSRLGRTTFPTKTILVLFRVKELHTEIAICWKYSKQSKDDLDLLYHRWSWWRFYWRPLGFNEENCCSVHFWESSTCDFKCWSQQWNRYDLADFVAEIVGPLHLQQRQIVRTCYPASKQRQTLSVSRPTLVWIRERQNNNRAYQACLRRIQYNQERLANHCLNLLSWQPERLYDGYLQKLDRLTSQGLKPSWNKVKISSESKNGTLKQRLQGLNLRPEKVQNYQDRRSSLCNVYWWPQPRTTPLMVTVWD